MGLGNRWEQVLMMTLSFFSFLSALLLWVGRFVPGSRVPPVGPLRFCSFFPPARVSLLSIPLPFSSGFHPLVCVVWSRGRNTPVVIWNMQLSRLGFVVLAARACGPRVAGCHP